MADSTSLGDGLVVVSGGWLQKARDAVMGPRSIERRKGTTPTSMAGATPFIKGQGAHLIQKRNRLSTPGYALESLAARDDIIYSIRRTIRNAIGEMEWHIVPDLDAIKADLKRWFECTVIQSRYPGWGIEFTPQALPGDFFIKANASLRLLVQEEMANGAEARTSLRMREFFDNVLAAQEAIASSHIIYVKRLFDKPNPSAESSFRALCDLIVDDLTLYDMAAVVKNPRVNGTPGELYTIRGDQIRIYRCDDQSTPAPPAPAYDWYTEQKIKAYYNNLELVLMMQNQQSDGYGKSPMEYLIEQMVGGLYGDAYLSDWFQTSNLPFFVFDLGPNISQAEKDAVELEWNNRVINGRQRGIFIAAREGVKGFMPMSNADDKSETVIDKLKFWANRKTAAYGLSLNDIGFTEDLHRTTSESQDDHTATGINSTAVKVEGYINGEIVQGHMWLRNDPENELDLEGKVIQCFPFRDCKFEFVRKSKDKNLEDAEKGNVFVENGVLAPNEIRKELGLPPIEGGDTHVVYKGGTPIKVEDLPNIPEPQGSQDPSLAQPGEEDNEDQPDQPGQAQPSQQQPGQKKQTPPGEDQGDGAVKRINSLVDKIAKLAE